MQLPDANYELYLKQTKVTHTSPRRSKVAKAATESYLPFPELHGKVLEISIGLGIQNFALFLFLLKSLAYTLSQGSFVIRYILIVLSRIMARLIFVV